jgi:hypothetical protein
VGAPRRTGAHSRRSELARDTHSVPSIRHRIEKQPDAEETSITPRELGLRESPSRETEARQSPSTAWPFPLPRRDRNGVSSPSTRSLEHRSPQGVLQHARRTMIRQASSETWRRRDPGLLPSHPVRASRGSSVHPGIVIFSITSPEEPLPAMTKEGRSRSPGPASTKLTGAAPPQRRE